MTLLAIVAIGTAACVHTPAWDYFALRDSLRNSQLVFESRKAGRVAFLGGSITANPGWRDMVMQDLRERFPETRFDFINAGIPSMGSTPGAFRLSHDVLDHGHVDLLFVEAAVNDSTNGFGPVEQVRGMEGIVRHVRLSSPDTDIVMLHFADPGKLADYEKGKTPEVIASHEKVAARYGLPSIDLAREVFERIRAREFTWEKDFVDLHPSPFGQKLYYRSVQRLLDAAWGGKRATTAMLQHPLPKPLDSHSYANGRLVDIGEAHVVSGWRMVDRWHPTDGAGTREGFVDVPMLVAEKPGATLTLTFAGTGVGLMVAAGPDAGTVEFSVDGGPWRTRDLFTPWSPGLHIPWAYVLDGDLKPGKHELTLRIAGSGHSHSTGHAVRIRWLLVNRK